MQYNTVIRKCFKKCRSLFPLYWLSNKSIAFLQDQATAYERLYRSYQRLLEEDLPVEKEESSNKVWICWFQGEEKAPDLVKACISSVRRQLPDREIIILDENNLFDYVQLPKHIVMKWEKGFIPYAHFSDLIRIDLLCRYGGLWLDATVLMTGSLPDILLDNSPLFVFKQLDLVRQSQPPIVASSWLISAYRNNLILRKVRQLLWAYWDDYNWLMNYFVFHLFFTMATRRYADEWANVPSYNNHSPHVLFFELDKDYTDQDWERLCSFSPVHKLNHHLDYSALAQTSNYYHILNQFLEASDE